MNPFALAGSVAETLWRHHQEKKHKNDQINVACSRCHSTGPHRFRRMEPALLVPFSNHPIFLCSNCKAELKKDGTAITTLWDRVEGFFNAGKYKDSLCELETMVATSQIITARDREDIVRIKQELTNVNANQDQLKQQLRQLIQRIKSEG